ncbi:MAG: hypothetical protein AVDCRST_MAG07-655 [uncultured Frankineae bacterium]|uniref:Uncharacterized protein n=1 Tax=uncultured Frankineae bacterium TaxID=437475 RepID=A0A6J4KPP4_9ACTN|nr:MAG: hypothetical protein AVDCRST_MAG07-655 [uncultured Frankineae bacterium]
MTVRILTSSSWRRGRGHRRPGSGPAAGPGSRRPGLRRRHPGERARPWRPCAPAVDALPTHSGPCPSGVSPWPVPVDGGDRARDRGPCRRGSPERPPQPPGAARQRDHRRADGQAVQR